MPLSCRTTVGQDRNTCLAIFSLIGHQINKPLSDWKHACFWLDNTITYSKSFSSLEKLLKNPLYDWLAELTVTPSGRKRSRLAWGMMKQSWRSRSLSYMAAIKQVHRLCREKTADEALNCSWVLKRRNIVSLDEETEPVGPIMTGTKLLLTVYVHLMDKVHNTL